MSKHTYTKSHAVSGSRLGKHATLALSHMLCQGHVSVSKQHLHCHMLSQGHVSVSIQHLHYKLHCVTGSGSHEGLPAELCSTRLPIKIRAEKIKELTREDPPISSS